MKLKEIWDKLVKSIGIPKLILVMAAGVVLIVLSASDFTGRKDTVQKDTGADETAIRSNEEESETGYTKRLQKQLENTLANVSGVGKVKVMITLEGSSEKVTLSDPVYSSDTTTENDSSGGTRTEQSMKSEPETVFEENDDKKSPYVIKELQPQIKGVLVVAEGGDNDTVKKEIIEAVMVLFGLESHKIKVMKLE